MKKTYDAVQNLSPIYRAAQYIENADAIIIAAGAGMSLDSSLPAFRGSEGLWPTLLPDGMRQGEIGSLTQAKCFAARPVQAWKFYGRALEVCRDTPPHDGYRLIQQWAAQKRYGTFVYTSNVGGHFQAAGFAEERVVECHGTINMLQCTIPCGAAC